MTHDNIPDGIYVVKPGKEWVTVENGKQMIWKAPDYDLEYLMRGHKDRLDFRGPIDGTREPQNPTRAELTEHLPPEYRSLL